MMQQPTPGIDAQTPDLSKRELPDLKQLFIQEMMPGSPGQYNPYNILSAISKKVESAKAIKAAENMRAVQANAAQSGISSVAQGTMQEADSLMQPQQPQQSPQGPMPMQGGGTQFAARGGVMRSYNGGGIVALTRGGNPGLESMQVPPEVQSRRDLIRKQILEAELRTAMARAQAGDKNAALDAEALRREISRLRIFPAAVNQSEMVRVQQQTEAGPQFSFSQPPENVIPQLEAQLGRVSPSERRGLETEIQRLKGTVGQTPPSGATRGITAASPLPPETENIISKLRTQSGLSDEELAGRAETDRLYKERMELIRKIGEEDYSEAEARRKKELSKAEISPFRLAAGISQQRGSVVKSLASALAGEEERVSKTQKEIEKEYAEAKRARRLLDRDFLQLQMLDEERKQARRRGDSEKEMQIERSIYDITTNARNRAEDVAARTRGLDIQASGVDVQRIAANRPTELDLFIKDPAKFKEFIRTKSPVEQKNSLDKLRLYADSITKSLGDARGEQKAELLKELAVVRQLLAQELGLPAAPSGAAPAGKVDRNNPLLRQ